MQKSVYLKYSLGCVVTIDVPDNASTLDILEKADNVFKNNIELSYDDKLIDDCNIGSCYSFAVEEE